MILFQKDDAKYRQIKIFLNRLDINSSAINGSPITAPFAILKSGRRVKIYVFRYLNDNASFFKTSLRVASELTVILLCCLLKIKIWWLCHNVDKETVSNFPRLSRFRRYIISKVAVRILTTNKLLVPKAEARFNHTRISYITFGYLKEQVYDGLGSSLKTEDKLLSWLRSKKKIESKYIFCIGTPTTKSLHFYHINEFINMLNKTSKIYSWYAVVVGAPVEKNDYVFNIRDKYNINPEIIKEYCDYYYRIIDDLSISYSVFEASEYRIPIITENFGFLPELINYYKIGLVIYDYDDIEDQILRQQTFDFERFVRENNWELAAHNISNAYHTDLNNLKDD